MPIALSLDLGTTTITALAVDIADGKIIGCVTMANDAEVTSRERKARGWSEWDVERIASLALRALHSIADMLGPRAREAAGIGLTGQQHGVVLGSRAFDSVRLAGLLRQLKEACGTGGTIKDEIIELQGDHVKRARELLAQIAYRVRS